MSISYNLIDEPWIPCMLEGDKVQKFGLFEVLLKAQDIRGIYDPSPPVTVSLHRLLLAVLHRNFGPKNLSSWKRLFDKGRWDEGILDSYFNRWRNRFDLFHPEYPFFQVAELKHKGEELQKGYELLSSAKLYPELASGNNPTLFDHTMDDTLIELMPDEAARLLVSCQNYHLGGLVSRIAGEPSSAKAGPLAKGATVYFRGGNLFETLMYNLITYNPEHGIPFPCHQQHEDLPAWEQDASPHRIERIPRGYLDYLTWQSMRIKLFPEFTNGQAIVPRIILAAGVQMTGNEHIDPQFAYRKNLKAKPGESPWFPLRFNPDRVIWRDSTSLFAAGLEQHRNPLSCSQVSRLINEGFINPSARYQFSVAGLCSNKAKMEFWRYEELPVPVDYFTNPELSDYLRESLELAELARWFLLVALQKMPNQDRGKQEHRIKSKPPAAVNSMALQMYWSQLEHPFYVHLEELPHRPDSSIEAWQTLALS